jgi:hypothetical protein
MMSVNDLSWLSVATSVAALGVAPNADTVLERAVTAPRYRILFLPILGGMPSEKDYFGSIIEVAGDSPKDVLAAQIRDQGVACDKPVRAVRDAKRSKPDYDVWVLTCENATYRVSRYPDLAAKIERLR